MEVKTFDLHQDHLKTFFSFDRSVTQHSVDLVQLELEVERMRSVIRTLYEARNKFVHERLREVGIDPEALKEFKVDTSGKVTAVLMDRQAGPQEQPENGSAS